MYCKMAGYGHGSYIPFRINYNRCKSPHHSCPVPPAKLKTGIPFTGGGIPSTIATPARKCAFLANYRGGGVKLVWVYNDINAFGRYTGAPGGSGKPLQNTFGANFNG